MPLTRDSKSPSRAPAPAVSGGLDHGIGAHPHAPPAEILPDVALEVEDFAGRVVGRLILEVEDIDRRTVQLPASLRIEIGGGDAGHDRPVIEARIMSRSDLRAPLRVLR